MVANNTGNGQRDLEDADDRDTMRAVAFSPTAYDLARHNAALLGIGIGPAVSQALALMRDVLETEASGGRVLVEKRSGRLQKLTPRVGK